jgi:hypothetical protein
MRIQSILAIKLRGIVDAVIRTSALQNLRRLFPRRETAFFCTSQTWLIERPSYSPSYPAAAGKRRDTPEIFGSACWTSIRA